MTTWTKYNFACDPDECDTLIEVTCRDFGFPNGVTQLTCPCGRVMQYLSAQDATIDPINPEKKEEQNMETMTDTFMQDKIKDLEEIISRQNSALATHQNCDYWKSENGRIGRQLIELVNDAYDDNKDASEILNGICEIIDYNPVKEIEFAGTIKFNGRIEVSRAEVDDFDLTEFLSDVYVDINNGNVIIEDYELYDAEEC